MRNRRLEAEWRARLKASGFQDLESTDRDAPLSDRGNLHAVTETDSSHEGLAQRMESGGEYRAWAMSVLHDSTRLRNPRRLAARALERRIWERHANGDGFRVIAAAEGISFHDARNAVNRIKNDVGAKSKQGNKEEKWRSNELARRYRRLSYPATIALAALLLKTQMRSSTRRSGS